MTKRRSSAILDLKNLGPVSSEWLRVVGIFSLADLEKVGSVGAYLRVIDHGFKPTLNLLYAMEACLRDIHWTRLPAGVKERLRQRAGSHRPTFRQARLR